jgi:hypothetical protein
VTLQSASVTGASGAALVLGVSRLARPGPCAVTATNASGSAAGTLDVTPGPTLGVPADAAVSLTAAGRTASVAFAASAGALVHGRARAAVGTAVAGIGSTAAVRRTGSRRSRRARANRT